MNEFLRKLKKRLPVILVISAFVVLMVLVCYLESCTAEELNVVAWEFSRLLVCVGIGILAILPVSCVLVLILAFLDWKAVGTGVHLVGNFLSAKIATKNAQVIAPCLRQFLYFVLSQNREFLHLPLGKDASCLVPAGYAPAYRNGCAFYRFQMVAPEKPEMDLTVLRLVIQNYIATELMNYGISGLASCFQSIRVGGLPSVFLDRVLYDENHHCLAFDVLYVCTEDAAQYVSKAIQREAAAKQPEAEVFDDDLQ